MNEHSIQTLCKEIAGRNLNADVVCFYSFAPGKPCKKCQSQAITPHTHELKRRTRRAVYNNNNKLNDVLSVCV